jgi:hypothetical protein
LILNKSSGSKGSVLSHYTDFGGLAGLVRTQSVRAAEYNSMSDTSEMMYALQILITEAMQKFVSCFPDKSILREDLEENFAEEVSVQFIESFRTILNPPSGYGSWYIASFARGRNKDEDKRGILTLWDRYTRLSGFCLQFLEADLRRCVEREMEYRSYEYFGIHEVTYEMDRNSSEYQELVDEIHGLIMFEVVSILNRFDLLPQFYLKPQMDLFARKLFVYCVTHKDPQYIDEREIRIIASPSDKAIASPLAGFKTTIPIQILNRGSAQSTRRYLMLFDGFLPALNPVRILTGPKVSPDDSAMLLQLWGRMPKIEHCGISLR